jgi:hypothetical protein
MGRTCLYSFWGAGIGFVVGFAIVWMVAGGDPPGRDVVAVGSFAGIFLGGAGAIAGAIVGAVDHFRRQQQAKEPRAESRSDSDAAP